MSDFNIQFEEQNQSITLEFEQIGGGAVKSVNGKTGVVVLDADDVGAYTKPTGGIPKTDLASAVQTSLGKADSAYQKPSGGIPASDIASGVVLAVDNTLTVSGAAADAKKTGDEISDLKDGLSSVENNILTDNIREALLQLASKVAYIDDDGQDYYDALEDALYPSAELVSISAVYTQSGTVYETDFLDSLKNDLVVTAHMSDSTTRTVTTYTLSGTLAAGTSTITVSYSGKTTTFDASVTAWDILWSYSDGLPEANGFTKTYNQNASVSLDSNGLLCTATGNANLAWTPNNESSCTKTVFECVFVPKVLSSQSTANGNGVKFAVFNGTRASTISVNSKGVCGYKASISGYEVGYSDINVDTEYTIRIETEGDTGTVSINGVVVYTVPLGSTSTTNSRIFAAINTGVSTLFKSWRYKFIS
jgi:hypothetical protein